MAATNSSPSSQEEDIKPNILRDEVLELLSSGAAEGVLDKTLRDHFGERYNEIPKVLNVLLNERRVRLMESQNKQLVYQLVDVDTAEKLKGLGAEQMMVFQVIEKSGNLGIWVRDIKAQTNIQHQTLQKVLKNLETRKLIKSVKSIAFKSKKLFMLYDMQPAREITGGPWYTEQEFDHEFIEELSKFIYAYIKKEGKASLKQVADLVRVSGISKIELSPDDFQTIINSLVYDGKIEEVRGFYGAHQAADGSPVYKASRIVEPMNHFTSMPCGMCPVMALCEEHGEISPSTCEYYTKWLEMQEMMDF